MRNEPRPGSSTTVRTLQLESSEAWIGFGNSYTENRLQLPNLAGTSVNSRWMRNASDLTSLAVTSVVPVDLNAFILKVLVFNWSIFDEGLGWNKCGIIRNQSKPKQELNEEIAPDTRHGQPVSANTTVLGVKMQKFEAINS